MRVVIREKRNIVSVDSDAFKLLIDAVNKIEQYLFKTENPEDVFLDNFDVRSYLKISESTLYRIRRKGLISYSKISNRYYYKLSEVKRMIRENYVRSEGEK